jgi:hypothetical protein
MQNYKIDLCLFSVCVCVYIYISILEYKTCENMKEYPKKTMIF